MISRCHPRRRNGSPANMPDVTRRLSMKVMTRPGRVRPRLFQGNLRVRGDFAGFLKTGSDKEPVLGRAPGPLSPIIARIWSYGAIIMTVPYKSRTFIFIHILESRALRLRSPGLP